MPPPAELWPRLEAFPPESLPRHVLGLKGDVVSWAKLTPVNSGGAAARSKRPSAVMMLFVPPQTPGSPAELLFTKRSVHLRSHRGQISFAGGRSDPQDLSPAATAIRELQEELGVAPEAVTIVGTLPPVTALDRQPVYPVVAMAAVRPDDLVMAAAEVEAVFTVPWPALARGQGHGFSFNIFGNWRLAHSYPVPAGNIWGLTAHILHSASLE